MQLHKILILVSLTFILACQGKKSGDRITIVTEAGDIEVELYPQKAPLTVASFLRNVREGYYDRSSFYRVLNLQNQPSNAPKTELIQGGIWQKKNKPSNTVNIPHEPTSITGLRHIDGTLSMARTDTGTASTEFFICVEDQPGLDYGGPSNADGQGYAAFGRVVKGMNIVRKVYNKPEDGQYFIRPITIFRIEEN